MEDSMDIDIDLGDGIDYDQSADQGMVTQTATITEQQPAAKDDDIPDAYKDDFDADFPAKEKVYIKGLEGVAQPLIFQFLEEHVPDHKVRRIEWIDDSSANIIYYKNEDAADALLRLSVVQDTAPASLELRPAKVFNARPDLQFQVRQALVSDKKKPGAKDRSAFYLFNPEWDPENRRYDNRYDRRGRGGRNAPRAPRNDSRRKRPSEQTFTEDMYDDAPPGQTADEGELMRRMSTTSLSSGEHFRRRQSYEDVDLFEDKRARHRRDDGRLRDRSRSPVRNAEGDGRYGFDEQPSRKRARRRSWTLPRERLPRESRAAESKKDLFADHTPASSETPLSNGNRGLELFPNHSASRSRELFPHKTGRSNHRRSDALGKEETDALTPKRSLADRITEGPDGIAVRGRGKVTEDTGFSIRGASNLQSDFSIRGASRELNPRVKELFPDKAAGGGNTGKELFPTGPRARGGQRRRAEDLFD
ncbi:hypothetical protein B9Z65_8683 [Elsinoe australis]|uniref:Nuclear cap-binding protein subunit 3 n=1 Tax=Elsinoe australis TaxID=40998 RepID=A0A2P7YEI1_9PEZI|nr:hypothetical protein B9Z65_8683 [Elsinoe australis]